MSGIEVIILAAMAEELAPFLAQAQSVSEPVRVGHAVHRTAELEGRRVLLVQSGIGLVNAAGAATSALLVAADDGANAPLVLSVGTAGGIGSEVRVGDVVLGSCYINIDADARAFGYELGQVPGMPARYTPDAALVAAGTVAAERPGQSLHTGLLVSSYSFVGPERALLIREQFPGAQATDMESSALAQICHGHGVPFLSIRGVSDLCGPASDADFRTHVDDAADCSAEVALRVIPRALAAARVAA